MARASGVIALEDLAVKEIDLMQFSQAWRKGLILVRMDVARTLLQPLPQMGRLEVCHAAWRAKVSKAIHDYLCSSRRIIVRRR